MEILKITSSANQKKVLQKVLQVLKNGGVVAHPTETVFGLAADAQNPFAVQRIHVLKQSNPAKPLLINLAAKGWLAQLVTLNANLRKIIRDFWPGPLALILKTQKGERQGFRCSSHPLAKLVTRQFQKPLISTSANLAGSPPANSAAEVWQIFQCRKNKPALILDDGSRCSGVPSTILDLSGPIPKLVRVGGRKKSGAKIKEEIRAFLADQTRQVKEAALTKAGENRGTD